MSVDWSSVWEGGGRTGMERLEEERDVARAEAARLRGDVADMSAARWDALREAARLREVIEAARPVLEREWASNHAEHCRNEWPHDGECYWPRPEALAALERLEGDR